MELREKEAGRHFLGVCWQLSISKAVTRAVTHLLKCVGGHNGLDRKRTETQGNKALLVPSFIS